MKLPQQKFFTRLHWYNQCDTINILDVESPIYICGMYLTQAPIILILTILTKSRCAVQKFWTQKSEVA